MSYEQKIQEMQLLEQSLQNVLLQKQAFHMELSETQSALKEISASGDEIFKIIGHLMIKSEKSMVKEELENKEKLLNLRLKTLEKQESGLAGKMEKLRDDVIKERQSAKKK
ncbi:prefoldin subunit beta [Candidatus Pacearchaeota archaeon]|nr:prefoldin subunit beta [Candidatus Pacearchaeota archaeon]